VDAIASLLFSPFTHDGATRAPGDLLVAALERLASPVKQRRMREELRATALESATIAPTLRGIPEATRGIPQ
jgi:hypothetical protein